MNIEGWRALKVLAVEQEATLNALAVEAFNDLPKKHGSASASKTRCWIDLAEYFAIVYWRE
jgi:hypothetical protein